MAMAALYVPKLLNLGNKNRLQLAIKLITFSIIDFQLQWLTVIQCKIITVSNSSRSSNVTAINTRMTSRAQSAKLCYECHLLSNTKLK